MYNFQKYTAKKKRVNLMPKSQQISNLVDKEMNKVVKLKD